MQKTKKQRPFDAEIRQMRRNHVILVNISKVNQFVQECKNRGIVLGKGSEYENGVIYYEQY